MLLSKHALTSWATQTPGLNQGVTHAPGEVTGAIKQDCLCGLGVI